MRKEDFCYPIDFVYIDKKGFHNCWKLSKVKAILALLIYIPMGIVFMIGYYVLFPFRWLHEICEDHCYR